MPRPHFPLAAKPLLRLICLALLPAALLPTTALADPPGNAPAIPRGTALSAAEFDAYATGKTLFYAQGGTVWGAEQYLPGHQVLWAFTGQPCEYGQWYEDNGAICFVYEGRPEANCWHFFRGATGLVARFLGGSGLLSEVGQTTEPMNCPGPQVGT